MTLGRLAAPPFPSYRQRRVPVLHVLQKPPGGPQRPVGCGGRTRTKTRGFDAVVEGGCGWSHDASRCSTAWTQPSWMPACSTGFPGRAASVPCASAASTSAVLAPRAVMQALLALSPNPAGFTSPELAARVARLLKDERYSPSRAAYDLRKFRSKGLVSMIPRSRRYLVDPRLSTRWPPCSCFATRWSARSSPRHPGPTERPRPASAASWTDATPVFTRKCKASSTPSESPLEPASSHFHDGWPASA